MKLKAVSSKWLVFAGAFIIGAITYWTIPYEDLVLLGFIFTLRWAIYSAIISLIVHLRAKILSGMLAFWIASGFVSAVLIRIIYESSGNAIAHNLWPLELILIFGITFIPAFLVGLLSKSIGRIIRKEKE
jgi:hypothetical protein